jgi:hypothetical protein
MTLLGKQFIAMCHSYIHELDNLHFENERDIDNEL